MNFQAIKIYDENEGAECQEFDNLKFKNKNINWDLIIVVPMVNEEFSSEKITKINSYANKYNSLL